MSKKAEYILKEFIKLSMCAGFCILVVFGGELKIKYMKLQKHSDAQETEINNLTYQLKQCRFLYSKCWK